MKKLIALTLAVLMILSLFSACGGGQTANPDEIGESNVQPTAAPNDPLSDGTSLKVLAIGNSFSNDTTEFLYDVAKAEGVTDIVLGRLYIGGCSLEKHANNAATNAPAYKYYRNTAGVWIPRESITMEYALQDEQWDIITLQQNSGNSGLPASYNGYLEQLIQYVNENKTNPNARLVWNMTWAYQEGSPEGGFKNYDNDQTTMYSAIVNTVKEVIEPNTAFSRIIPVGTALQNVRTSYIGDNVTRDTYHLNTLGKVIGAYTWYAVFTGKTLDTLKLELSPTILLLTDNDKATIAEAVNAAIQTPYAVTQSTHLTR